MLRSFEGKKLHKVTEVNKPTNLQPLNINSQLTSQFIYGHLNVDKLMKESRTTVFVVLVVKDYE